MKRDKQMVIETKIVVTEYQIDAKTPDEAKALIEYDSEGWYEPVRMKVISREIVCNG